MDEWITRRERKVTFQVMVDPSTHTVDAYWGRPSGFLRKVHIAAVFVNYRSRDSGDWERRVSLISSNTKVPVLNVPVDVGSIPSWLEDIITQAEGLER